jgi:hypothetical protein
MQFDLMHSLLFLGLVREEYKAAPGDGEAKREDRERDANVSPAIFVDAEKIIVFHIVFILNSKLEGNFKFQNSNFIFLSDFGFRASNLSQLN